MSDPAPRRNEADSVDDRADSSGTRTRPRVTDGVADTDAYEIEEGVVLYDVDNPLAWVEADTAVELRRMV